MSKIHCPKCKSTDTIYYGYNSYGKQRYKYKTCGKQFVENPRRPKILKEKKAAIQRCLTERITLSGISRVFQVSYSWLQNYANKVYECVEKAITNTTKPRKVRLLFECDEIWSFVGSKKNRVWIWFAMDRDTRKILSVYFGDRSERSAKNFWDSLPQNYIENGIALTDKLESYASAFPKNQLIQCEKSSGCTSYIERLNLTVRMQNSRLVRKSIGYSRKLVNHIGSLFLWIHEYNSRIEKKM